MRYERSVKLFCRLVGQYVGSDSGCQCDEEKTESPMLCDKDSAVEKGYPDHAYREDLDLQGNGFMHHEIADVRTELRVVQKPVIK